MNGLINKHYTILLWKVKQKLEYNKQYLFLFVGIMHISVSFQ